MEPDLETFEMASAWTIGDAAKSGVLDIRGKRPNLQQVQRWANPRRGYQPIGKDGPTLVLPTVKVGREYLTMPDWVQWFANARTAAFIERAKKFRTIAAAPTDRKTADRVSKLRKRVGF